jgi:nucleotide-binding universal stress UspA family protein
MPQRFKQIVHPTDFSDGSADAFAHALRIALATKSKLYLVHVAGSQYLDEQDGFPHIRSALALWRLLEENDPPDAVVQKLGIAVAKVGLRHENPLRGLLSFLDEHPSDLVVLATHGRDGLAHWMRGSIAEQLSRTARLPTLFLPPSARGFVDQASGELQLSRVLVPVDHVPHPAAALNTIREFIRPISDQGTAVGLLHVGKIAPLIQNEANGAILPVALRAGEVVGAILEVADEQQAELIAMPTTGHHGILDALRGSTTERVLRHAPCPVLAIPVE